ncbi:hypothetical protein LTR22_019012 [Elasticomyces elasticus]|nr:hypothetical protein LTR22_019012 [Elasticomyces elasticus]KAK5747755.1 hypothetical protein LTS12_022197 [Elasticomyces elasticus]
MDTSEFIILNMEDIALSALLFRRNNVFPVARLMQNYLTVIAARHSSPLPFVRQAYLARHTSQTLSPEALDDVVQLKFLLADREIEWTRLRLGMAVFFAAGEERQRIVEDLVFLSQIARALRML